MAVYGLTGRQVARVARAVDAVEKKVIRKRRWSANQGAPPSQQSAYYFNTTQASDTSVTVSNIRWMHDETMETLSNQTVSIPTTAGTYYVFMLIYYNAAYIDSIEVSDVDTHPDQAKESSTYYAVRQEVAEVVVADSIIASVKQIWPGHIMTIPGQRV